MDPAIVLALLRQSGGSPRPLRALLEWSARTGHPLDTLCGTHPAESMRVLPPGFEDAARLLASCTPETREDAARHAERAAAAGVQTVLVTAADYPEALRAALRVDAPPVLFTVGDASLLHRPMVSIVGARRVSPRGLSLARACAKLAVETGFAVCSGAAPGVDDAAHESALFHDGATLLLLPQGILTFRASRACHDAVDDGRALLVSALPPAQPWNKPAALARNTSIATLGRAVCVIGPRESGGSAFTANQALRLGCSVFVWCEDGQELAQRRFQRAGAGPMLDGDGRLRHAALHEAWTAAEGSGRVQTELL